jgi:hypothetical protein
VTLYTQVKVRVRVKVRFRVRVRVRKILYGDTIHSSKGKG